MMVYFKLILTAFFWGGTFIAGRVVMKHVEPFSAAFLRFSVASVFLFLFAWKVEGGLPKIKKNQILPLVMLGATGVFLYNVFFFKGLQIIEAGRAAIIIANNPICIALLSAYFFKEKLNVLKIIGITLSVSGAFIVISRGSLMVITQGNLGWGELYIFGCVLSWAAFTLIGKSVLKDLSPIASITYSSILGGAFLSVPAFFEGILQNIARYTLTDWGGIFFLGFFGTVLGFVWYYEGLVRIGPTKASLFINFVPISAILFAFFILGEPLTVSLGGGTILVSFGVYLTNAASFRPAFEKSLFKG
jgi:drug/metabolite transporter (DMT)-like permease